MRGKCKFYIHRKEHKTIHGTQDFFSNMPLLTEGDFGDEYGEETSCFSFYGFYILLWFDFFGPKHLKMALSILKWKLYFDNNIVYFPFNHGHIT